VNLDTYQSWCVVTFPSEYLVLSPSFSKTYIREDTSLAAKDPTLIQINQREKSFSSFIPSFQEVPNQNVPRFALQL
jgi:hypothetical protein